MYKIHKEIKEPVLLKIQSISDDRGILLPFTDDIDHELFKRSYIVENYGKAAIRGMHYHKKEFKIYTILSGAAKFITMQLPPELADNNNDKEIQDYLKQHPEAIKTWVMSSRHHGVLGIPPYYANGWVGLEANTLLLGLSSLRFEEAMTDDLRINPYVIGNDKWEIVAR